MNESPPRSEPPRPPERATSPREDSTPTDDGRERLSRFEAFEHRSQEPARPLRDEFNAQVASPVDTSSSGDSHAPSTAESERLSRFDHFSSRMTARDVGRDRGGKDSGGGGGSGTGGSEPGGRE